MSTSNTLPTTSPAALGNTPPQNTGTGTAKNTPHRRRANAAAAEQPRKPLTQRFIDAVNPSTEKRIQNVSRAIVKKVDTHIAKFLDAVASGSERKATQELFKIRDVLAPMKNEHHSKVGPWHELFAERLVHGKCALKYLDAQKFQLLGENLSEFSLVHQNDAFKQLNYSIKAEQLRRDFKGLHWGITAPRAGTRPITVLPGDALDKLRERAKELLKDAPAPKAYTDVEPDILGTLFTRTELQIAVADFKDARQFQIDASATVNALSTTLLTRPIDQRPFDEIVALKEAVDCLANMDDVKPGTPLKQLQKLMEKVHDALLVKYEKRIETLLEGPVAQFDARQWANEELVELKEKIREFPSKHPTRAHIEDAIQTDIDRRKRDVQNELDTALRAALTGNPSDDALHDLLVSAADKWLDAKNLFEQLNEQLSRNDVTDWINNTLTRHISTGPQALDPLKRLQSHVNALRDQLQEDGIGSEFLDLLSSCFQATSPVASVRAPKKRRAKDVPTQNRADKEKSPQAPRKKQDVAKTPKPPASEKWDLAEARVQVKVARLLGVDIEMGLEEQKALLTAVSVVVGETQDLEELQTLKDWLPSLKLQDVDAGRIQELSAKADVRLSQLSTS